jgi:hypothetical protein
MSVSFSFANWCITMFALKKSLLLLQAFLENTNDG